MKKAGPKKRGKYGTGMLDDTAKKMNTRKTRVQSQLDSIMGGLAEGRGQRRRKNQDTYDKGRR